MGYACCMYTSGIFISYLPVVTVGVLSAVELKRSVNKYFLSPKPLCVVVQTWVLNSLPQRAFLIANATVV